MSESGGGCATGGTPAVIEVDIQEQETWLFFIEGGEVLGCEVVPIGGETVDDAITEHVRRDVGLGISDRTAESLKLRLGGGGRVFQVKGRCPDSGKPQTAGVDPTGLYSAAMNALAPVQTAVAELRERCERPDIGVIMVGDPIPGLTCFLSRGTVEMH